MDYGALALEKHKQLKGKICIQNKDTLDSRDQLSTYYSPGVAAVSSHLAAHPEETRDYTWTNNCVAVISDGSAVLGLGNIGPEGALPVMEGKAMLFKHFANIDAVPIVLNVHTVDEIVATVSAMAPSFGGINLEDIAAPQCFEIEERLKSALSIPIMHDDQHGTAIVTLAGLINACKVTGRELKQSKVVLVGSGAAGTAIAKLLYKYCGLEIICVDSKGILYKGRADINEQKAQLLDFTNPHSIEGDLAAAVKGADIFIGVSQPNILTAEMIKTMKPDPIVFAMANPNPEVTPEVASAAGVAVMATGRSDYPNQVNNALAFPGIFRGALDNRVRMITDEHKIMAAEVIAGLVESPSATEIVPAVGDTRLVPAIAAVIK